MSKFKVGDHVKMVRNNTKDGTKPLPMIGLKAIITASLEPCDEYNWELTFSEKDATTININQSFLHSGFSGNRNRCYFVFNSTLEFWTAPQTPEKPDLIPEEQQELEFWGLDKPFEYPGQDEDGMINGKFL